MTTEETYVTFGSVLTLRHLEHEPDSYSMQVGPPPFDTRLPDMPMSQLMGFQSGKGYLRDWLLLMRETRPGGVITGSTRICCEMIRAPITVFLRANTAVVAHYLDALRDALRNKRTVVMRLAKCDNAKYRLTGIEMVQQQ